MGYIFKFCTIVQFISILDVCTSVKITQLNIPILVDPANTLALDCQYDMDGEELHSVKWYKDEQEFFRYMPRQQPHIISFHVAGVHTSSPQCSMTQCSVQLTRLHTVYSSGAYKCEVSTEAPKFQVGFNSKNVTVASLGTEPEVQGLRELYSPGDLVQVNCSVSNADPSPVLSWLLNGASLDAVGPHRTAEGTTWRELRLHAEPRHFPGPRRVLQLACLAVQPGVPAPPRVSPPVTARLLDLTATIATATRRQQTDILDWLKSKGTILSVEAALLLSVAILIFY